MKMLLIEKKKTSSSFKIYPQRTYDNAIARDKERHIASKFIRSELADSRLSLFTKSKLHWADTVQEIT